MRDDPCDQRRRELEELASADLDGEITSLVVAEMYQWPAMDREVAAVGAWPNDFEQEDEPSREHPSVAMAGR